MPHDKHGRKIERGDVVVADRVWPEAGPAARKVIGVCEGAESCNLNVVAFEAQVPCHSVTAAETELLLKHDGSKPEAPAKA